MFYCTKCGNPITDDSAVFCPKCGFKVNSSAQQTNSTQQSDFSSKFAEFNNTEDTTGQFDQNDIEQNKVWGVLSYLSLLVLIPIFAAKDSKFARFHANQGLVLLIFQIAWGVIDSLICALLGLFLWPVPVIYTLITKILSLVGIVFLVFTVIGIINVVNGKAKKLPVIGHITLLK